MPALVDASAMRQAGGDRQAISLAVGAGSGLGNSVVLTAGEQGKVCVHLGGESRVGKERKTLSLGVLQGRKWYAGHGGR